MNLLSTGELAKLFNITKYTIRHYLDKDLLTFTQKDDNGYHLFSEADIYRLYQIIIFRELGLSIQEIKRTLEKETIKEELKKAELTLEEKITQLSALKKSVQQINLAQEKYPVDDITFLDYPDRYLSVIPEQLIKEKTIDYSKEAFLDLEKIYYIFSKDNQLCLLSKSNNNTFDYHFPQGTYISKTFIANEENEFNQQISLFLADSLIKIKEYTLEDLLIFENIDCSLAHSNHMLYTVEVKA